MKSILLIVILMGSISSYAQQIDIPQKEFTLALESASIALSPGENKKIEVRILKSKGYQKGKVQMGLSSALPAGVSLSFDPEKGNIDSTTATITVQPQASPGQYAIIVNVTINYKTKGSILKLEIK
jgi:uncharacterized membrane protein